MRETEHRSVPALAGVHRITFPVSDVRRSSAWYQACLGYESHAELIDSGTVTAVRLRHPDGGPELALRLSPRCAVAAAGFDSFVIGVPDKAAIDALAVRLAMAGEGHGGVHPTATGWVLPLVHDPDGRELRFATVCAVPWPTHRSKELSGSRPRRRA